MTPGRDHWYHEAVGREKPYCPAEEVPHRILLLLTLPSVTPSSFSRLFPVLDCGSQPSYHDFDSELLCCFIVS